MPEHPDETQLAAFVMGELTGESERSQTPLEAPVEAHLCTCAQCQAAVARLQEVVAVSDGLAGRAITQEELSKAHEALLERLRREIIPVDRPAWRRFRPLLRWLAPSLAAAAACVAVALVLLVPQGSGQVVLADVRQALREVPWVRVTGTARRVSPGKATPKEANFEFWFGVEPPRRAERYSFLDGVVTRLDTARLYDTGERRLYSYALKTDTVTVHHFGAQYEKVDSPMAAVAWLVGHGPLVVFDEVGRRREVRGGRDVDVLTFERLPVPLYDTDLESQQLVIACDLETKLPLEVSTIGRREGQVIFEASGTVDYPAAGPTSIYDLGVPRTAKVVSYLPEADVMALQDRIDAHLERFGPVYDAVLYARHVSGIAKTPPSDESYIFRVRYDRGRLRFDVYDLLAADEDPTLEAPSPDGLAAIKAWMTPERFYWTLLVGEEWVHRLGGWGTGNRGKLFKAPRSFLYRKGENFLTGRLWPHAVRGRIRGLRLRPIEEDNGLLCLERSSQGWIHYGLRGKVVRVQVTSSRRFFVNPQRDYVVERREYEHRYGERQEDPDWDKLPADQLRKVPRDYIDVTTVVRYGQTEAGQWYPREDREQRYVLTESDERQPDGPEGTWHIHLETPASIPDEVFDPESLGPTTEE